MLTNPKLFYKSFLVNEIKGGTRDLFIGLAVRVTGIHMVLSHIRRAETIYHEIEIKNNGLLVCPGDLFSFGLNICPETADNPDKIFKFFI